MKTNYFLALAAFLIATMPISSNETNKTVGNLHLSAPGLVATNYSVGSDGITVNLPKKYLTKLNQFKYNIFATNNGQNKKANGRLIITVNNKVWHSSEILDYTGVADTGEVIIDPEDLNIRDEAVVINVKVVGTVEKYNGNLIINGVTQDDAPPPVGKLYIGSYFPKGGKPTVGWAITRDGTEPNITILPPGTGIITHPAPEPENGILYDGHNNNGHGNNYDGVDVSNPGKGKGGPTGLNNSGMDPSNGVDDEIRQRFLKK